MRKLLNLDTGPEDSLDWDGPNVAAALSYLLDSTNLLSHLDSTERGAIRRAIELLECQPAEPARTAKTGPIQ